MRKVRTNYPLEINDYNYDLLKCFCHKEQRVAYNCTICGEHTEKFIFTLKSPQFLCRKHQIEATAKERYGSVERMQQMNLEHGRQTKKEKYGNENYVNLEKAKLTKKERYGDENYTNRERAKNTLRERYGVDNCSQIEGSRDKAKETWVTNYGVDNPMKDSEIKQKQIDTVNQKYGVENVSVLEHIKLLKKQTSLEHYGIDHPMKVPAIKEKVANTNIQKYGSSCYLTSEMHQNYMMETYGTLHPYMRYIYNGMYFDSSWEVAFYIYNVDLGRTVIREPVALPFEFQGKQHLYFPDFEVDGQLYEVKGPQFFKEDGTLFNPFDSSQDALFEAKRQCGVNHNVHFVSDSEMVPVFGYIDYRYGDGYLGQFKTSE